MSLLIIPMAGKGQRFLEKGYKTYKPFLKIYNSQIINHICNLFPKTYKKICIVSNKIDKKYLDSLNKIKNLKVIKISPHKKGPGYTLFMAQEFISEHKEVYVAYSDIIWIWNAKKFNKKKNAIFCYKGDHPFTRDNNNYAFCNIDSKKNLLSLREKKSFTKNWLSEPLSIGLFYFVDTENMFKKINLLIKKKIQTNNEYFPSECLNFQNKDTKIHFVKNFLHLGKPDYYEIFKNWEKFFIEEKKFRKKISSSDLFDEIIIPAAGDGKRFKKENIEKKKFLINLPGPNLSVLEYINNYLPTKEIKIVLKKNVKLKRNSNFNKIIIKKSTGQAFSVLCALNKINPQKSFLINSCDVFSVFDLSKFSKLREKSDIIVFLSSKSFNELGENSYTWGAFREDRLLKLNIKKKGKQNNQKIITGNFYFKNKEIYQKCYYQTIFSKKELYVEELINTAISIGLKVYCIKDDYYINFGTPALIKNFNYWYKFFKHNE